MIKRVLPVVLMCLLVGGGNIALNVWSTGEALLFYIGSSDSWIDGRMPRDVSQVKLGRVRLTLSPNPFSGNFRQELDLVSNSIRISGTAKDGTEVKLRVWVDAVRPVVHVEGNASRPPWRSRLGGARGVWTVRPSRGGIATRALREPGQRPSRNKESQRLGSRCRTRSKT